MHGTSLQVDCLRKCQIGNRNAFRQLYDYSFDHLLKVASRYTPDGSAAKDVLHASYLKIFDKIKDYKGESGLIMAWMSRIVINEALQRIRKNRRMEFPANFDEYDQAIYPRTESNIAVEEIMETIQNMPEELKTIFTLREIDQYSHREIADLLGITESHSRTKLTRAKAYLRKALGDIKLYVA